MTSPSGGSAGDETTTLPTMSKLAPVPTPVTERDIIAMLVRRYTKVSMGAHRFAFADHVPTNAGFAARIADFIAVDTWTAQRPRLPLRNEIHGHEVKVSRADLLAELRDLSKAEAFRPYCHRWWLVIADRNMIKPHEIPETWGLMVKAGASVRVARPAPLIDPDPMPPAMIAAMMRAVAKTARREVRSGV